MEATHSIKITYVAADCGSIIPGKSKAAAVFHDDLNISTKLLDAGVDIISHADALTTPALYQPLSHILGKIRNKTANLSVLRQVR